mgnify:CR=1 FL=1
MNKIIDEIRHLWSYHIFKIIVSIAIISVLLVILK